MKKLILSSLLLSFILLACGTLKTLQQGSTSLTSFEKEFAFNYEKGFIFVPIEIQGKTYNFLYDTGAELSVLDLSLAEELNLKTLKRVKVRNAKDLAKKVKIVEVDNILLGDVEFLNTAALLMDVSAFSKYIRCEKVHGIIGNNLMRKANWQIDYQHQIMRLVSLDKNFATSQNALQTKMNANIVGNVKLNLTINNITETYTFDTGFNGFAQTGDTSLLKNTTPITKVGVKGATFKGAKMGETHLIKIDSFQLNGLNFIAPNYFVVKPDNGAVLGNEFYENFVLTLNWATDTLTLDPIHNPKYYTSPIFDISFFTDYQAQLITVASIDKSSDLFNRIVPNSKILRINQYDINEIIQQGKLCNFWTTEWPELEKLNELKITIEKEGVQQTFISRKLIN